MPLYGAVFFGNIMDYEIVFINRKLERIFSDKLNGLRSRINDNFHSQNLTMKFKSKVKARMEESIKKYSDIESFLSNEKINNILKKYFEDTLKSSKTLNLIIPAKTKGKIYIDYVDGNVYTDEVLICIVNTHEILERIWTIIKDCNLFEMINIVSDNDIYNPLLEKLNNNKINFKVKAYSESYTLNNNYTEFYKKVIKIRNKINHYMNEINIFDDSVYFTNMELDDIEPYPRFIVNFDTEIASKITLHNIHKFHKKPSYNIVSNMLIKKYYDLSMKDFNSMLKSIRFVQDKINNYMNGISSQRLISNIYLCHPEDRIQKDNEVYMRFYFNDFYKNDAHSETSFLLNIKDLLSKDINKILSMYYETNIEIKKFYTLKEFLVQPSNVFKNLIMMHY